MRLRPAPDGQPVGPPHLAEQVHAVPGPEARHPHVRIASVRGIAVVEPDGRSLQRQPLGLADRRGVAINARE
eukprot:12599917-Alexandrium_andersonii.AAC.1